MIKKKKSKTFVYLIQVSFMAYYKGKIIADFLNRYS